MISIFALLEDLKPQVHFGWGEEFDRSEGHVFSYLNAWFSLSGFHAFHLWEKNGGISGQEMYNVY